MGCLWAARIFQHAQQGPARNRSPVPVTLLLRDEAALAHWQRVGGVLVHTHGSEELVPVSASIIAKTLHPIDNVLLCTKAQNSLEALDSVAHLLHANTRVLLMQNGTKAQRAIAERFPTLALYCLSTSHGAYLRSDFDVVHAGQGDSYLGSLFPARRLCSAQGLEILHSLPSVSMNIVWDADITGRLWTKFSVNCAINALSVIYDCRNGELQTLPAAAAQLRELCAEIDSIMLTVEGCPQPLELLTKVDAVLAMTAHNYSSTLQDVRKGRPTEIAYFNGYLRELAQLAGMDCPLNDAVLSEFKAIVKHASD